MYVHLSRVLWVMKRCAGLTQCLTTCAGADDVCGATCVCVCVCLVQRACVYVYVVQRMCMCLYVVQRMYMFVL
jgi:hypothetical protein